MSLIHIEVAYALPAHQWLLRLAVPAGTTALEAATQAVASGQLGELDLAAHQLGIFGQLLKAPQERVLEEGERVEIYRPLLADPKEIRKARAKQARKRLRQTSD